MNWNFQNLFAKVIHVQFENWIQLKLHFSIKIIFFNWIFNFQLEGEGEGASLWTEGIVPEWGWGRLFVNVENWKLKIENSIEENNFNWKLKFQLNSTFKSDTTGKSRFLIFDFLLTIINHSQIYISYENFQNLNSKVDSWFLTIFKWQYLRYYSERIFKMKIFMHIINLSNFSNFYS